MSFIKDFRDFAVRGNVVDLAVGVVIGGAFGKIVTSLVNDIIMPPIGWLTGGIDFSSMKWVITPADPAHKVQEVAISYGSFINTLVAFIIVAFAIFILVRMINKLYHKAAAAPTADVALLTEIRDLLKEQRDRQAGG